MRTAYDRKSRRFRCFEYFYPTGKKTVLKETMKALPLAKPPFGTLRTENSDHFAAVYVNGHFMGHVDEFSNFAQGLLLNPGKYE